MSGSFSSFMQALDHRREVISRGNWAVICSRLHGVLWVILMRCLAGKKDYLKGRPLSSFQEWVCANGLIDLDFNQPRFIWNHVKELQQKRLARLDRALAEPSGQSRFLEAMVLHCTHVHSDHCPLLLDTHPHRTSSPRARPFRFQAVWLSTGTSNSSQRKTGTKGFSGLTQ